MPTSLDVFRDIVLAWKRMPDPTVAFTLQQIGHIALGSGTPKNAAVVGRVMAEFGTYFHAPSLGGYKWKVRWQAVAQDHPDLLDARPPRPSGTPLEQMDRALKDEVAAVRREMEENPIIGLWVLALSPSGDGSFLYEVGIELAQDAELPIPEGVDVLLRWRGHVEPSHVEAKLLSYDSPSARLIVEVERPLDSQQLTQPFHVLPRVDELLLLVQQRLKMLGQSPSSLSWRLLRDRGRPRGAAGSVRHAWSSLDPSQRTAVERALAQDITFLWGPPGTGKTHTLAHLIAALALSGVRVVATSIANVAVDQLARRLVRALEDSGPGGVRLLDEGRILRFGHARLPEVTGERRLFPNKEEIQRLRRALHDARARHRAIPQANFEERARSQKVLNDLTARLRSTTRWTIEQAGVVLTTAVQACIEPALTDTPFAVMVVDEASMMPIPYLMCMGLLGRDRLIVAGDFRQLGPIAVSRTQAAYDWLHKDAFELVGITKGLEHPALQMLTVQRRMHGEICGCINRAFYEGRLRTEVEPSTTSACLLEPLPGHATVLVEVTPEHGSTVETTPGHSRVNHTTARVTSALARWVGRQDPAAEVAVVTPYRGQVSAIKRLLKDAGEELGRESRIKVGTVHAFQGSEADVVIWDLVETRSFRIGKLYHGDSGSRLTNVAVSRAKGKLIVVGDPQAFIEAPAHNMVRQPTYLLAHAFPPHGQNVVDVRRLQPKLH